MSKLLLAIRFILLNLLIVILYLVLKKVDMVGLSIPLLILFLGIYYVFTIFDIISKNDFKHNKKYNIFSSIVLITMIIIFLRVLYDSHFIYNNQDFLKEYNNYTKALYDSVDNYQQFKDQLSFFVMNNAMFFNILFLLLFLYRKINRTKNKIDFLKI